MTAVGMLRSSFSPSQVYLDSATYGLPPTAVLDELATVTNSWASGRYDPVSCDQAVASARASFARLHGVEAGDVAIGHQVSPMVALVAGSLRRGANVLAPEGDFTSLLFPFLAASCALQSVPLDQLAQAIDARTDLVAVSAVQSADGCVADLEAIASAAAHHGALTLIDASPGKRLAAARRLPVRCAGHRRLQVAVSSSRDRLHDRPPRCSRAARTRRGGVVRRRGTVANLLRHAAETGRRRPPLRCVARLAQLARRGCSAQALRGGGHRAHPRARRRAREPATNWSRSRVQRFGNRLLCHRRRRCEATCERRRQGLGSWGPRAPQLPPLQPEQRHRSRA